MSLDSKHRTPFRFAPWFRYGSFAVLALFLALFIFGSTDSAKRWLGVTAPWLIDRMGLFELAGVGLTFLLLTLSRLYQFLENPHTSYDTRPAARAEAIAWGWPKTREQRLKAGLLVALFVQSLYFVRQPFSWDEANVAMILPDTKWSEVVNPIHRYSITNSTDTSQTVSMLGAYLGHRLFALTETSIRSFSLFLALCFLVSFYFLSEGVLSPSAVALIVLQCLVNVTAAWYLVSARGYISALLFTLVAFFILLRESLGKSLRKETGAFFFTLSCFLAPLSHKFGGIFCVLLLVAWVVWLYENRNALGAGFLRRGLHFFWLGSAALFIFPALAMVQFSMLSELGFFAGADARPDLILGGLLGLPRTVWARTLLVLVFGIGLAVRFRPRGELSNFNALFVLTSLGVFCGLFATLSVSAIQQRFFLPFLIPILILLAETPSLFARKAIQAAVAVALLVLLVLFPLAYRSEVFKSQFSILVPFTQFVRQTQRRIGADPGQCISFEGDLHEVEFAKRIFFREQIESPGKACRARYHIVFASGRSLAQQAGDGLVPLWTDEKGRTLYLHPE